MLGFRSLSFGLNQDVAKVLNALTEQQIKQRHAVSVLTPSHLHTHTHTHTHTPSHTHTRTPSHTHTLTHQVESAVKERLKAFGDKQKQQLRVSHMTPSPIT